MALGAVYDWGFAVAILLFKARAAALLGLSLPADPVYLDLNAVFLVLLGGLYLLPARDPERYRGVVAIAAAGRFLGFLFLGSAWLDGRPLAFLALSLGDLAFALAHAILLLAAVRRHS